MYLALESELPNSCRISVHGSTQVPDESRFVLNLQDCYPLWLAFPHHSSNESFCNSHMSRPYNPSQASLTGLGFSHFARHYSGNDLFSSGYLDVSVPQDPYTNLYIQLVLLRVRRSGFPHSDISGYNACHTSPELFAVTHVLHRHLTPRHPP